MPYLSSDKYDLVGNYNIEETSGKFYRFKGDCGLFGCKSVAFYPESELEHIEGFKKGVKKQSFQDFQHNLYGEYYIDEVNGKFYKLNQRGEHIVYVPESDIKSIKGFPKGGRRRHRNATKKARKTRRRHTRRNY